MTAHDLEALRIGEGDIVAVIDAPIDGSPPVRHREIVAAIDRGALVVGASGVGALRAVELRSLGMRGVGSVFRAYLSGRVAADDEVVWPSDEWRLQKEYPAEPLINMRCRVRSALRAAAVGRDAYRTLMRALKNVPCVDRSYDVLFGATRGAGMNDIQRHVFERYVRQSVRDDAGVMSRDAVRLLRVLAGARRMGARQDAGRDLRRLDGATATVKALCAAKLDMQVFTSAQVFNPRFIEVRRRAALISIAAAVARQYGLDVPRGAERREANRNRHRGEVPGRWPQADQRQLIRRIAAYIGTADGSDEGLLNAIAVHALQLDGLIGEPSLDGLYAWLSPDERRQDLHAALGLVASRMCRVPNDLLIVELRRAGIYREHLNYVTRLRSWQARRPALRIAPPDEAILRWLTQVRGGHGDEWSLLDRGCLSVDQYLFNAREHYMFANFGEGACLIRRLCEMAAIGASGQLEDR